MNQTPLRVTAHLVAGIAHATPWTISLDGLLASRLWAEAKKHDPTIHAALEQPNPPDLDLPLARCEIDPQRWHWAATCGWPNQVTDRPEIHWWHTDLDDRHTENTATQLPQHLSHRNGRWKAYRMPLPITVTQRLTWHAVGDPEAVEALLQPIVAIGKKRSQGEGRVSRWIVEETDRDPWEAAHLSPTGALARPTPAACLNQRTVTDGGDGYAGIRPPHMHPSRRTDVRLPAPHAA